MNDTATARDALLDWAYDESCGDTTTIVEIMPFAEEHQLDPDAAFARVDICKDAGLPVMTLPSATPVCG